MPKPLTVWITTNRKIIQEMGIPDHLTCLLRNLYAGQEATVRTGHGTTDWFQIGKGVHQGCILSPCLFNLYAEYFMWSAGLPWRRKWQSPPVLLPGKSHGQRSLVGYSPWSRKELDMAEWVHFHFQNVLSITCLHLTKWGENTVKISSLFLGKEWGVFYKHLHQIPHFTLPRVISPTKTCEMLLLDEAWAYL